MAVRTTRRASSPKKTTTPHRPQTGCLIWAVLFLATLLLFVIKWDTIQQTLRDTNFLKVVSSRDAGTEETREPVPVPEPASPEGDGSATTAAPSASSQQDTQTATQPERTVEAQNKPAENTVAVQDTATQPPAITTQPKPGISTPAEQIRQTRISSLFFVKVDDDGTISRQEVKRTIPASNSPLTDALQALLGGPSGDELNQNLITLIPSGTRLLGAQVRGSTAYLNFSEDFMYNRYGVEGYAGQLKQIVYTATEFSSVKDVLFLIEGQSREYLGGEGVYIGKPLSRNSF